MQPATSLAANRPARLLFIDNLRWLLPVVVIAVHVAVTYGSVGSWFYVEPATSKVEAGILSLLVVLAQSFGMGFFFMVAGYFTPRSYDRKGAASFLKDRALRLGLPLLVFALAVSPWLEWAKERTLRGSQTSYLDYLAAFYRDLGLYPGPLWFVEVLLLFAVGYALWRLTLGRGPDAAAPFPGLARMLGFVALLSVAEFTMRVFWHVGEEWQHVQLGFMPQYVFMFAVGTVASRGAWAEAMPERVGRVWSIVAVVMACVIPVLVAVAPIDAERGQAFLGGLHWESAALCVWESLFCVAMAIAVPYQFRRRFDRQGPVLAAMSRCSYSVFFIHAPILVAVGWVLRPLVLPSLVKFALVAPVVVALCFATSHFVLRRLPGMRLLF